MPVLGGLKQTKREKKNKKGNICLVSLVINQKAEVL